MQEAVGNERATGQGKSHWGSKEPSSIFLELMAAKKKFVMERKKTFSQGKRNRRTNNDDIYDDIYQECRTVQEFIGTEERMA